MNLKGILAAATLAALGGPAFAQPYQGPNSDRDPNGYYSQTDQQGYYDRNGLYRRFNERDFRDNGPSPESYYEQGRYEQNCRRGNAAAGTIFGAIAGGLIGSAASHGNGGAVAGGAILGGLLGNAVSQDIDCDDQPYAFQEFSVGLNGDIGRRYEWNHGQARGYFIPTREFRRGDVICRDFTETSYRAGRAYTRAGTACRQSDGNWRFD